MIRKSLVNLAGPSLRDWRTLGKAALKICVLLASVKVMLILVHLNGQSLDNKAQLSNSSIHFILLSGHPLPDHRAECSVESAALRNPHRSVILWLVKVSNDNTDSQLALFRKLQSLYSNIEIRTIDPAEYLQYPLRRGWFETKLDKKSGNFPNHITDALRLAILYRHGGAYFDADVISLKSISYDKPFLIYGSGTRISNAVLQLEPNSKIGKSALAMLDKFYDPNCWACIGANLLNATFVLSDQQIERLPAFKFTPIYCTTLSEEFTSNTPYELLAPKTTDSIGVHLCNKITARFTVNHTDFLRQLYQMNCRHTFDIKDREDM